MRNLPTFDSNQISDIIHRGYGVKVLSIEPYRHVFRLKTNLGINFFKPFHQTETRLQLIVQAKEHLHTQGFTEFCPFIRTLEGKSYLRVGNQLYYMTPWIEGHPANYDSPFELRQSMQLFARLHQAARGFTPPPAMLSYLGKWPQIFSQRIKDLQECQERAKAMQHSSVVERCFLKEVNFYIAEAEKSLTMLKNTDYKKICQEAFDLLPFCHHDSAHHNVLITPDNSSILIDFDYLIQDLHLHDLGSLVIRNAKSSTWNLKRTEYLLNAYAEVQKISQNELEVIRAFITFPYDIWFWARSRYIEEQQWPLTYYLKEWERKTRNENERQKFLTNFMQVEV